MKSVLSFLLAPLLVAVCHGQTTGPSDTYPGEFERSPAIDPHFAAKIQSNAREQQEQFRERISIPDAVGDEVPSMVAIKHAAQRTITATPPPSWVSRLEDGTNVLSIFAILVLTAGLVMRKLAPGLFSPIVARLDLSGLTPDSAAALLAKVRAEEAGLSEFLVALKAGPARTDRAVVTDGTSKTPSLHAGVINSFLEKSPARIETQELMLGEIKRAEPEGSRQKLLAALRWELHALRNECGVPELLPVWQLAFALEALLKQLVENSANVTPSALCTVEGGLAMLKEISCSGIAPDLLTREPLRFLVVDDDPISRNAISSALKYALTEPAFAADGKTALALVLAQTYDAIFLDVEMPKVNGFELSSRIHETAANRNTPVILVTSQSDFETRAKTISSIADDLIGKPFLTLEITVKALTSALRRRLATRSGDSQPEASPIVPFTESSDTILLSRAFAGVIPDAGENFEARQIASRFLAGASEHLASLREVFQVLVPTLDPTTRRDLLGDIYLHVHSFIPYEDLPAMHPAIQLGAALEGLLRKLLENPRNAASSTLFTLATGVQLLDDLCRLGAELTLKVDLPFRMLVVDDDPVSRRTVALALQMAFDKPDIAESGPAALALAEVRPYDVIFMDVQMPGMDGSEAYERIRQTQANGSTPVVFVAGHRDFRSRTRVGMSGASDFIERPFLTPEITLKALIFALRARLKPVGRNEVGLVAV